MFKKTIYSLIITLLFASTIFAQNDNKLIPLDDEYYIQSAINYGKNNGGFWDLPGHKDFAVAQKFSVWAYTPEKKTYGHYLAMEKMQTESINFTNQKTMSI